MATQNGGACVHPAGFFRKNVPYLNQYLQVAATLISDIDDDAQWEQGVFGEEDELVENDTVPHVVGITVGAARGRDG